MSYLPDLESAQQWIHDWQAEILDKATRARELSALVSGLRGVAESRDGAVRVRSFSSTTSTDSFLAATRNPASIFVCRTRARIVGSPVRLAVTT